MDRNKTVSKTRNSPATLAQPFMGLLSLFWGNSPHSPVIFKMQKRVIRTLMGIGYKESRRGLFKDLKILPFASQYILSLLLCCWS
jgi:hypothetical protein